jgi:tetratricopeptide (TPR) repeat protein
LDSLLSDPRFRKRLVKRWREGWTFEKIEPMSTDEVFARLNRLGVAVTPEEFQETAQRHESAERLADEWYERYPLRYEGRYDEDFVWMAAVVLWKRLIPDRISFEQINERMQEGYDLLEAQHTDEACDVWWQVWQWLKEKVTPERNTVAALDKAFRGTQSVFNWYWHFEMELWNAGLDDPAYLRLRIRYCREFLEVFPHEEWSLRGNMLRAEAETLWELGEVATAESKFEALVEANPDWAWGYIGWSDEYWLMPDTSKAYAKAERILQRALSRPDLEDREDVLDRLESLRAERAQARSTRPRQKQRNKRRKKRRRRRKR